MFNQLPSLSPNSANLPWCGIMPWHCP